MPHARSSQAVYWRRRTVVGGLIGLGGYGLVRGLGALGGWKMSASSRLGPTAAAAGNSAAVSIAAENGLPGTTEYSFPFEDEVLAKIKGYASTDRAKAGDVVSIMSSTTGTSVVARAFRMGWYGGAGGREVWRGGPFAGLHQAEPLVDPTTGMIECRWTPTVDVAIDSSWTPGMYLVRLDSDDGGSTFVPLVVTSDQPADILVISAITTWQAYNEWGGASLYYGVDGKPSSRAKVVSFDRPYDESGSGHFFGGEWELVQLIESLGYSVNYTTNLDVHTRPEQTTAGYKVIISLAHDEYYSLEMRQALEAARDAGVNLMFLGANAIFRRIRLEPAYGRPDRRMVNYRVANNDPLYRNGDDARVTANWRNPPAADPESSLIGNLYESNPCEGDMVVVDADAWVFAGTGLRNGDTLAGIVGNEYDRVTPEQPTPDNIQVLCHSPVVVHGHSTFADMTYYTHRGSGAGVWATGTLWWERHLGPPCDGGDGGRHSLECHVRRITANVLEVFTAGPAGATHPSMNNLERFGIRAGYVQDPPPG